MTSTLPSELVWNPRRLAAHLAEHHLPGQRSMTAIARLRKQRAAHRLPAPRPLPVRERLNARLVAAAGAEIRRRGGEISIDGDRASVGLLVWDRDPGRRIALVGARGWRQYSKSYGARPAVLAYLYGTDDAGRWAVRVPGTVRTVAEALAWLEPAEVTQARAAGRQVLRQGDVYAVQTRPGRDGTGAGELPEEHRWNPTTRYLTHHPADGRKHRPLRVPFPARFLRQRTYQMGRGTGRGFGD